MKLVLLLSVLYVVSSETDYGNLNKTDSIKPLEYGTQAAKDIRAIGRSYAYQLIKKQLFTDYATAVNEIIDDTSLETIDKGKKYAETYTVHVAAVGAGIILAIFLGIGFCFTPICCCACNNSQKHDSGMALWRMIWGSLLVILLAANIAGLTILAVSGQQILTLEDETTNTVSTMATGFVSYLEQTDKQLDTMKADQMKTFFGNIEPLVENAIDKAITQVKADTDLSTGVTDSVASLNNFDTLLGEATTNIDALSTSVTDLESTINTINTNLKTCKDQLANCNDNKCNAIDGSNFDPAFDPNDMNSGEINTVKDNIGKLQSFPDGADAKTVAEWATFVQEKWDTLDTTTKTELATTLTDYKNMVTDAEAEVVKQLDESVQSHLKSLQGTIKTESDDITVELTATLSYIKSLMLLQEGKTQDVMEPIVEVLEDDIFKYIPFGLFVLICVILGLLVLTVIVGLAATLFGCCTVNDETLTTERKSGPCGSLLMCTSYCSVILCAIACLVAAILVTVVIASEGTCKQYSDNKLLDQLEVMGQKLGISQLDLGKMLEDALELGENSLNLQEVMTSCSKNATVFTAFNIEQDTKIMGTFSFDSLKTDIETKINEFDVNSAVDGMATITVMDASAKADLETNKDSLKDYDYAGIKTTVEGASFTSIPNLQDLIDNLDGVTEMGDCRLGLQDIQTTRLSAATTQQTAVVTALTDMEGTANSATSELTNLLAAVNKIDGRLTDDTFVKKIVKEEANSAKNIALTEVTGFIDWLYGQFRNNLGSCQPIYSVYTTVFNYTCDGILIHLTLLYCGMSLIGISLLFYMCVSRCLARYFIKYNRLHPEDEGGNGWTPVAEHRASSARLSIYDGNTKPRSYSGKKSARSGNRVLASPRDVPLSSEIVLISNPSLTNDTVRMSATSMPRTSPPSTSPTLYGQQQYVLHMPETPRTRAVVLPPLDNVAQHSDTSSF